MSHTHVLHRSLRQTPPVAVRGQGVWVYDSTGRAYLDGSGGAAVSCLGHNHPDIQAAMHAQIDALSYAHTSFFTTEVAERLADRLVADAPAGISHAYFVSGGSEAVEAALKMARQYFVEIGQPERRHIVARRQSYHGNTLGALAVGGNAWRRAQFAPLLIEVEHVSPCYAYRDQRDGESAEQYGERLAQELEQTFERLGPGTVMAFVAEPVVGATAGAVTAVPGYFRRMREVCDRHGVLLIADEVMCGMGRTGTLYAIEQEGVTPDLITIAKGLGGGYQPIGAVMAQRRIVEAMQQGSGFFQHGHTYLGHAVACAASLAVQDVIRRDGLLARVREQGAGLRERLERALGGHPQVGDIRGRGLFMGIELVQDRATRQTFDPALSLHARVKREAMARGLMVYPMGGTIDGRQGDHVLLAPPLHHHGRRTGPIDRTPGRRHRRRHRADARLSAAPAGAAGGIRCAPPPALRGYVTIRTGRSAARGMRQPPAKTGNLTGKNPKRSLHDHVRQTPLGPSQWLVARRGGPGHGIAVRGAGSCRRSTEVRQYRHGRRHRRLLCRRRRHLPSRQQGSFHPRHPLLGRIDRRFGLQRQHHQGWRAGPGRRAVRRRLQRL
ncbi:putative aminotransferase [Achromobacter agilis]|uniref:Putative aminotransferase n=1 Tax=Achromobacter agilis TaxID=1353888 RepID=A0A446CKG1_9BURK|nr:putative aminotransferase [Achromobacter agilis]